MMQLRQRTRKRRTAETCSQAFHTFQQNTDAVLHLLKLGNRELRATHGAISRTQAHVDTLISKNRLVAAKAREAVVAKAKADIEAARKVVAETDDAMNANIKKMEKAVARANTGLDSVLERLRTLHMWQVVVLVTCCEAYLQDVLSAAAGVDNELMARSGQCAAYSEVFTANSLDELAEAMRARWARAWLRDGGPRRWLQALEKMGARGYSPGLDARLERVWGIRHVVVHAAGKADSDFVRRHPGVVAQAGEYVRLSIDDVMHAAKDAFNFVEVTESYFTSRWPTLAVATRVS
jgi:hypothetical protein